MPYDRCRVCWHTWHGLVCTFVAFDGAPECGCPSRWEAAAVLVEGDALEHVPGDS